jgi:hypothetical protein
VRRLCRDRTRFRRDGEELQQGVSLSAWTTSVRQCRITTRPVIAGAASLHPDGNAHEQPPSYGEHAVANHNCRRAVVVRLRDRQTWFADRTGFRRRASSARLAPTVRISLPPMNTASTPGGVRALTKSKPRRRLRAARLSIIPTPDRVEIRRQNAQARGAPNTVGFPRLVGYRQGADTCRDTEGAIACESKELASPHMAVEAHRVVPNVSRGRKHNEMNGAQSIACVRSGRGQRAEPT